MIRYIRCSEVDIQKVYDAFSIGFSDYIIKIQMPKEAFVERFFGPEGNNLETSFIALDEEKPVGLVLGGIKNYEGIKTMRCGTMAIDPEYRGKGISHNLMKLHREEALFQGCKQLFLEVIVGNDRAINFYKKLGYDKIYDLTYFSLDNLKHIKQTSIKNLNIKEISMEELNIFSKKTSNIHINWQNDMDYIAQLNGQKNYGAFINNELIAVVSVNKNTKINYLYVNQGYRGRHIAATLISNAANKLQLEKLSAGFPNNASLIGFLKQMGFKKDNISQYEMYVIL